MPVAQLTDKEATVLDIMARGEDMLAIGHWEPIIESLVAKGFAVRVLDKWHRATPEGLAAFEEFENEQMRTMIKEHNERIRERNAPVIEGQATECQQ